MKWVALCLSWSSHSSKANCCCSSACQSSFMPSATRWTFTRWLGSWRSMISLLRKTQAMMAPISSHLIPPIAMDCPGLEVVAPCGRGRRSSATLGACHRLDSRGLASHDMSVMCGGVSKRQRHHMPFLHAGRIRSLHKMEKLQPSSKWPMGAACSGLRPQDAKARSQKGREDVPCHTSTSFHQ
jgi:hypothetical protein